MSTQFLGRDVFDHNTQMYSFKDGTGKVPIEMQHELYAAIATAKAYGDGAGVLGLLFDWKDKLKQGNK